MIPLRWSRLSAGNDGYRAGVVLLRRNPWITISLRADLKVRRRSKFHAVFSGRLHGKLPSEEGGIHQARLRFRQRDAPLSQQRSLFLDEAGQRIWRSILPFWHVHKLSEDWFIDTKSYLLL